MKLSHSNDKSIFQQLAAKESKMAGVVVLLASTYMNTKRYKYSLLMGAIKMPAVVFESGDNFLAAPLRKDIGPFKRPSRFGIKSAF